MKKILIVFVFLFIGTIGIFAQDNSREILPKGEILLKNYDGSTHTVVWSNVMAFRDLRTNNIIIRRISEPKGFENSHIQFEKRNGYWDSTVDTDEEVIIYVTNPKHHGVASVSKDGKVTLSYADSCKYTRL